MMNARIYIRIFMAILFLGMMPSCTYETIHVGGLDENANVTLTLALGDQAVQVSRATVEDVEPENSISTVDLFFYKANDGESVAPVHIEKKITSISNGKISFSMPTDKFEELFPNNETTTCKVFAIVNRPAENGTYNVLPADATVANLKNMVLYTDFTSDQASFVMHSNGMVTINRTQTNGLNGTIPVKRVAAKIGFELMFPANVDETLQNKLIVKNGNVIEWTAAPSDVDVKLYFGSRSTKLGSTTNGELFNVDYTTYTDNLSFYTYPTNWGKDESAHTHLMVKVVWTKYGGSSNNPDDQKTTFYEISNQNPGFEYIEQNHYYIIQQSISILGADSEDEAVELTPCYNVLDWGAAGLSGVLNRNRYLAVDETNVIMNNIVTKRIKFASSDPIDLSKVDVLWDFTGQEQAKTVYLAKITTVSKHTNNNGETEITVTGTGQNSRVIDKDGNIVYTISNTSAPLDENGNSVTHEVDDQNLAIRINTAEKAVTIKIDNTNKIIEISHALDNSMTDVSDFTKYMINLKVEHIVEEGEDKGLEETINITQYPMMYIEAVLNSDYKDRGTTNGAGINTALGYVYVNATQTGSGWADINGFPENSSINNNPNMYIVSISSLGNSSAAQDYIICDPRTQSAWPTNSGVLSSVTRTANDGSVLDKYKGTDREAVAGLIAPQFLVASSYGYCPNVINSLNDAERRCATYQEDGYPAGRWRVPTQAEIKYLIQLSENKIIPKLFSNNTWYWSAQGAVQYTGNGNFNGPSTGSSQRVRCVYDTWYWGTEPLTSKSFTYADEPR